MSTPKTPKTRSPRRLKALVRRSVANPRYSVCETANLRDLDWSHWWTVTSFGSHYLHVAHKDGETSHRVYARGHIGPRLEMRHGKLMWIYTPNVPAQRTAGH
jgi:hypothetical protein